MDKHTCGTCRYGYDWIMTKHTPPKINPRYSGMCSYRIPEPVWPASIPLYWRKLPTPGGVVADETNCPCWESKEVPNG
jgi:hypothetical protein